MATNLQVSNLRRDLFDTVFVSFKFASRKRPSDLEIKIMGFARRHATRHEIFVNLEEQVQRQQRSNPYFNPKPNL
jgi:hypothetical protein